MIGEPDTEKSQLLYYAYKISMRSVQTSGIGTISAGLTVSCFKDGMIGYWRQVHLSW